MISVKRKLELLLFTATISMFSFGNAQGTCTYKKVLNDMNSHEISSPNYPNGYPQDTECRWEIDVKKFQENKTIVLDFATTDIQDSENCTSEYIKIFSGTNDELAVLCGQQQKKYEFYIEYLVIVLKTGATGTDSRKGFRMTYRMLDEALCSKTINVNSLGFIPNTGENDDFPSFQRCTFLLKHATVDATVELTLDDNTPYFDCSREYLLVYAGTTEDSPLLDRWCGRGIEWYSNVDILVVIATFRRPLQLRTSYNEAACFHKKEITHSTNFEFFGSSGAACLWTVTNIQSLLTRMILTISNVQISCPDTKITVFDGRRRWSFCGDEERIFLVTGKTVSVASLVPDTVVQPVSFELHFRIEAISETLNGVKVDADCNAKRNNMTADEIERTILSPLYPRRYPSHVDCVWQLHAPYVNDTINIDVYNISLGSNCLDTLRIYNGDVFDFDTTKPDYVICGANNSEMISYKSKGGLVTIQFRSGGPAGGTGFKIIFSSPFEDILHRGDPPSVSNAGTVAAVVVVVLLVIIIAAIVVIAVVYFRKKRRAAQLPNIPVHVFMDTSNSKPVGRYNNSGGISNPAFSPKEVTDMSTNESQTVTSQSASLPPSYSKLDLKEDAI